MKEIILDYSANTHKNDLNKISETINAIKEIDSRKHKIVFKSQLFEKAGDNVPCKKDSFDFMYNTCLENGYECTASVFDMNSLEFLLSYDIPFIKIANNDIAKLLIDFIPRQFVLYVSYKSSLIDSMTFPKTWCIQDEIFHCVSEYPAKIEDYRCGTGRNISDHTVGLELFKKFSPLKWEKHLILPGDTGLDAGEFAITPNQLKEIL